MGAQDDSDEALRRELSGPNRELDEQRSPARHAAASTDQTRRHAVEEQIYRLGFRDNVTGLPNRAAIVREITADIESKPRGELSALLIVGVDDLSAVNDALGYEVGDRLLVDAAERLEAQIADFRGEHGYLARIGASTFGLLLTRLGIDRIAARTCAAELADRVFGAFASETALGAGVLVKQSVSIGSLLWVDPAAPVPLSAEGLIASSDPYEVLNSTNLARKQARRCGGQRRLRQFQQGMLDEARRRVHLMSQLRRGIDRGELQLYSQPIVDRDRRMIGAEGLVRWLHPERGLVSPQDFIPLAEQTGIIVEIGEWVIEEACKVIVGWQKELPARGLTFSVNLSERQLHVEDFGERVSSMIRKHGIEAGRLRFEITESALHTDLDRTITLLARLSTEGVSSSLDDFGTGYSSLSYLQRLPVQQLKIDRCFVSAMDHGGPSSSIVETIVQLGRAFSLQIVAEGVETEEQFEQLRELRVDAFQGYLFSRPQPIEELLPA